MEKVRSIKFNFIMNFILTISNFVFPLITFPYVSRILLASGNGKIAFASSIASYFGMVASLGIPTYGIRACANVRDDKEKLSKTVQELILIHSIVTAISLILFLISIFTIGKFYQEKELMIINGISLLLNVLGINWLYSALEKYQYITVRSIIFKIISIVLMFLLVHQQSDYVIYGIITVFAAAGSNILNFLNLKKFITLKKFTDYNLRQHMKPILIFFAQSVAISIYTNLDIVMLGFMKGDEIVGLYSASVKIKGILVSLVTSLGTVLLPRLSYYITNGFFEDFKRMIQKAIEFVLLISLPLTVFFIVMAKESILLLSGDGYLGAIAAMQVITPTIIFIGLSNITGIQILTPLKKEHYVLYSVIMGGIVDLLFNFIFIPIYGAAGAALGTLLAEITVLMIQIIYIRKVLKEKIFNINQILKLLSISLIASIPLFMVRSFFSTSIFIQLCIAGMTYFGIVGSLYLLLNVGGSKKYLSKIIHRNT